MLTKKVTLTMQGVNIARVEILHQKRHQ